MRNTRIPKRKPNNKTGVGFADRYLDKQKDFKPWFAGLPSAKLNYIVVIPAFREKDLTLALDSLWHCVRPGCHVEIIIVQNLPENADAETVEINRQVADHTSRWIDTHQADDFRFMLMDTFIMPLKDAGVGLARKKGMDEALSRFNIINNPSGYILSFDADSCCDTNYFSAIDEHILKVPFTKGFNVYFEHPLPPENTLKEDSGIVAYELHLRCLNLFTRSTGFPFAFHTVGSCFGVRADVYAAQGGMNRKKAGEDFYFLHKIISLGGFFEINNTRVIPSSRTSDRVPFGTGAAMNKFRETGVILTYAPECFVQLKLLFDSIPWMYNASSQRIKAIIDDLPDPIKKYLSDNNCVEAVVEINANSGSATAFRNRFFRWFDAFRIIKFLNYASMLHFPKVEVSNAAMSLLNISENPSGKYGNERELLIVLRETEKRRTG